MKFSALLFKNRWAYLLLFLGLVLGILGYLRAVQIKSKNSPQVSQELVTNESLPLDSEVISPQGVHIRLRVADSDTERVLGLSGFTELPDGQGMLFIFPQVGIHKFWMKDMNFPIDILWIDENGVIIDQDINVDPSSYPKTYTSSAPVNRVIELPATTSVRDGFTVGTRVEFFNTQ